MQVVSVQAQSRLSSRIIMSTFSSTNLCSSPFEKQSHPNQCTPQTSCCRRQSGSNHQSFPFLRTQSKLSKRVALESHVPSKIPWSPAPTSPPHQNPAKPHASSRSSLPTWTPTATAKPPCAPQPSYVSMKIVRPIKRHPSRLAATTRERHSANIGQFVPQTRTHRVSQRHGVLRLITRVPELNALVSSANVAIKMST